jgi:quercetin dioxygenase-like cupin family protein
MIVKSVHDLIGTERDVRGPVWASRRFLLAEDGVGFTLTETTTEAGAEQELWYKHHVEANYVIEGRGEVENMETRETPPQIVYANAPGVRVFPGAERSRNT